MKTFTLTEPGVEMAVRLRLACEAHDTSLGSHLDHVAGYACALGRVLGLPDERITALHYSAPLHDLGKIGLPVELVNKRGALTGDEMELIKTHTVMGHRILDGSEWSIVQSAALVALHHHENWDGTGYPHGLRGEAIPLDARIVAIADVYDALASQRSYKPAWDRAQIVEEMMRLRGAKFDPELVDVFLSSLSTIRAAVT
jgi:HD-GYP domain-containing protein (c-di-GMP phosphodiesterase class II)